MPEAPEDTYNRLLAKHDLVGLDGDKALWLIGTLTDLSKRLRRTEGLEQARRLTEELHLRELSADRKALSYYFLANVWANLRVLAGEDRGEWEKPELERELYNLRMALRHEATPGFESERVCQMLTNLANVLFGVGRPVEAIQCWDRALQRLPHFSMARGNRGHGLFYYAAALYDSEQHALMSPLTDRAHSSGPRPGDAQLYSRGPGSTVGL